MGLKVLLRSPVLNDPFDPCHYFLEGISADFGQFAEQLRRFIKANVLCDNLSDCRIYFRFAFHSCDIIRVVRRCRTAFCGLYLCATLSTSKEKGLASFTS